MSVHVLPGGFRRIRYYGLLGNRYRAEKLSRCRELLGMSKPADGEPDKNYRDHYEELTGISLCECPVCPLGHMAPLRVLRPIATAPSIVDTS